MTGRSDASSFVRAGGAVAKEAGHSESACAVKRQQSAVLEMVGADQPSLSGENGHELAVEWPVGVFDSAERDLLINRKVALERGRDDRIASVEAPCLA